MTAVVEVIYHKEQDGSWWANSPQIEGFTAGGETLNEVRELVYEGVPFYLDSDDVDIRERQVGGDRLVIVDISLPAWNEPVLVRPDAPTGLGQAVEAPVLEWAS